MFSVMTLVITGLITFLFGVLVGRALFGVQMGSDGEDGFE
jgi:hypothetical protein